MKRLVLLLSLVLLLALAACGLQPETQEVRPGEGTAAAGETPVKRQVRPRRCRPRRTSATSLAAPSSPR